MRHRIQGALVVASIVGTLTACAAPPLRPAATQSDAAISSQQRAALTDGAVTWDEYQAGFQAYDACLTKAGYPLVDPRVNGDLMDFRVPAAAVDSGVDAECYRFHWERLDDSWQIAHQDTSESARTVADCLRSNGIPAEERYEDNLALLTKNGIDIEDCPTGGK